jgi:UDP-glucose 4-epimerase
LSGASLAGSTVLVTGASGFLGRAICRELRRLEARCVALARHPADDPDERSPAVTLDLSSAEGWDRLDACGRVDAIVHCAAILPGAAPEREALVQNQLITHNLLAWAGARGVGHFVFASTCRVYGLQSAPCVESSPLQPPDLYALGKVSCELMVRTVLDRAEVPSCSLRISAPYGPDARTETVVRAFLTSGARGLPLTVQGTGERSQDFVYQEDVARAVCQALAARARGTYNVAGGVSVSVRTLAEAVLSLFGRDPGDGLRFSGTDPQQNYRGSFPVDSAYRGFGYRPQVTLARGLALTARAWGLL